jgi:hypothetical protein
MTAYSLKGALLMIETTVPPTRIELQCIPQTRPCPRRLSQTSLHLAHTADVATPRFARHREHPKQREFRAATATSRPSGIRSSEALPRSKAIDGDSSGSQTLYMRGLPPDVTEREVRHASAVVQSACFFLTHCAIGRVRMECRCHTYSARLTAILRLA